MSHRALGEQFTARLRYEFTPGGREQHTVRNNKVEAYDDRSRVGFLEWDHRPDGKPGTVANVFVHRDARRRGVASALWVQAHRQGVNPPKHSPVQTPMGRAWANGLVNQERGVKRRGAAPAAPGPGQESLF